MSEPLVEVWLRGPILGISPYLQPVAHALLQAREEVARIASDFPNGLLWQRPAGVASVGFHLRHLTGVIDRLFSYARGQALSESQRAALVSEGRPDRTATTVELVANFEKAVDYALEELRKLDEASLLGSRAVGKRQLPSSVLGLLFHAAEHTQRHVGQLLVTARIVTAREAPDGQID